MTLLIKLGTWITDHPKLFCVLLALGSCLLGVGIGRKLQQAPVSVQETATASGAAFGREDLTRKTEEGPWTREVWDMREPTLPRPELTQHSDAEGSRPTRPPDGKSDGSTSGHARPEPIPCGEVVRYVREEHGPAASETHSERESAQSTTQTLHFEQQGSLAPQWALSAGFENLLHEKALRLSVRRKFLGPIWVEGAFTPATRAVGAGLAVEF